MTDLITFTIVFTAQIILLSMYFPMKIVRRMKWVQAHYPEKTHPKLYPKSINFYQRSIKIYSILNGLIFMLGLVVLYFIHEGSLLGEKGVHAMLPWGYFMLQMFPTWIIEFYGFKMGKLMRQQDARTKKSAQLAPRRLFQYITPMLLSAVLIVYVLFVISAFYMDGFDFKWGGKALIMSLVLLLCYALFAGLSAWLIYGKKIDPYQSQQDRVKTVSIVIEAYCYTAMASAFFMAFAIAVSTYGLKSMMPVAMSVFLQFIVVMSMGFAMKKVRLEDINFDVYKAD